MHKPHIPAILVVALAIGAAASAQNVSERFYQAIRNDDLAALRSLVSNQGAGLKDVRGLTPLMYAAAFGSLDSMKLLISSGADAKIESRSGITALHLCAGDVRKVRLLLDHGAEINKASLTRRTPLLVAAGTSGSIEAVRLLLQHGADVNAADGSGFTSLILAASVDNTAVAKLLIEKGANINAKASTGSPANALMGAAYNGNPELTRALLSRNADVHATSNDRNGNVKNGTVAFGNVTALHLAALSGNAEVVKLLLDAGAPVNAPDVRGMTPLMWAVSSDRTNVEIVGMLMAKGADPSIRSNTGESTVDWARKFNNPAVLARLKLEALPIAAAPIERAVAGVTIATPREAVERSLPLLQRAAANVFTDGGCVACHAQPFAGMAVELARSRGWRVDDGVRKSVAEESERVVKNLTANIEVLLQGNERAGSPDSWVYESLMMAAVREPSDQGTDALVHYLAAKQRAAGNWVGIGATRAPMQDGDFSRTAMSIRTLAVYGMPGRKEEIAERIGRAADWLAKQTPRSTEDRAMQILGLKWAAVPARTLETPAKDLIVLQRADGGWSQTPYLASDAYATGQVLYALRETGVATDDSIIRRGVEFLVRTQKEDGSWYVKSRAMKIQPYFQSGFPYDHDQWISAAGTAWAVMALSSTSPEKTSIARVNTAK